MDLGDVEVSGKFFKSGGRHAERNWELLVKDRLSGYDTPIARKNKKVTIPGCKPF